MSICFVRLCCTSLRNIAYALWLSVINMAYGRDELDGDFTCSASTFMLSSLMLGMSANSFMILNHHLTSCIPALVAIHSPSAVDSATVFCLTLPQLATVHPRPILARHSQWQSDDHPCIDIDIQPNQLSLSSAISRPIFMSFN